MKSCLKILLITVMFVTLVLSGCKKITDPDGPLPDDECDGYPYQPAVAQVGDEVRSCHLLVQVFNFERDKYRAVREGRITIGFHVRIQLVKKVGSYVAAEDLFLLKDSDGKEYPNNNEYCGGPYLGGPPEFGQNPLDQGGSVEGFIFFEIPKGVTIVQVELYQGIYIPNLDYKDLIKWGI